MGFEYALRFAAPDNEAVADVLRRLPAARAVPNHHLRFDLGGDPPPGWPEATIEIEPAGAYFCDHGGAGAMLGVVIRALTSAFGAVTVEEL